VNATKPDAVVTGIGVAAPNGLGVTDYWSATLAGKSGIARIDAFDPSGYPATLAGQVPGFDATQHIPSRLIPQTDRMTRLALTATAEALADAEVDLAQLPEYAAGVVTASSAGGFEFGQRELQALWSKGSAHVSAYQSFAWFYAVNTGQISIRHDLRGPSGVLVSEQTGGLESLAQARRQLRKGTRLIVSGGVDGAICPWGWAAHLADGQLSRSSEPSQAFLPFSEDANGQVVGEGGAILVVEDAASARERGADVYGAVVGHAATFDPRPGSNREPGLRRAIQQALADAGVAPGEIDVVFADAAGLPESDAAEAEALNAVFGPEAVPVSVPKTMTGRLLAGGGALDVATALLALRHGVIPAAVHVSRAAADHRIDLVVGRPRPAELRHALVLARGRGGFNSALVLRRD